MTILYTSNTDVGELYTNKRHFCSQGDCAYESEIVFPEKH